MIASSTLHVSSLYFPFVLYFLRDKLTLLLLTPRFSSSQLYSLVQATLLPLTLTSVILFLLLEFGSDEVHVEKFLLPLVWVRAEVCLVCHGLVEARDNTIQDNVDEVVVSHLGIDIESIDIVQVFLHSTCLLEIIDLIKSPVRLIVVSKVFPNSVCNFSTSIKPMLVRFPPFQPLCFCT